MWWLASLPIHSSGSGCCGDLMRPRKAQLLRTVAAASLYTDVDNGRWRVTFADHLTESTSWTQRGLSAAASECIHKAWTHHADLSRQSERPPFDMAELLKHFQDV